uniref:Uncharacterized protein n=1 Tax=Phlebotomus papatasi TaxID=29031 RepID=A0A1B0GQC4_PHLPP
MENQEQESIPKPIIEIEPIDVRASLLTPGLNLSRRASLRPLSISPTPSATEVEEAPLEVIVVQRTAPKWTYGSMSNDELMQVKKQVGIIDVSFPEVQDPKFEDLSNFPLSYRSLTSKEKLILMFAENFRLQYNEKYIDRMPLVLAPKNECGVQKFVSTTIRPTSLHYPDLIGSWEKISSFVADHIEYEPLTEPTTIILIDILVDIFVVVIQNFIFHCIHHIILLLLVEVIVPAVCIVILLLSITLAPRFQVTNNTAYRTGNYCGLNFDLVVVIVEEKIIHKSQQSMLGISSLYSTMPQTSSPLHRNTPPTQSLTTAHTSTPPVAVSSPQITPRSSTPCGTSEDTKNQMWLWNWYKTMGATLMGNDKQFGQQQASMGGSSPSMVQLPHSTNGILNGTGKQQSLYNNILFSQLTKEEPTTVTNSEPEDLSHHPAVSQAATTTVTSGEEHLHSEERGDALPLSDYSSTIKNDPDAIAKASESPHGGQ